MISGGGILIAGQEQDDLGDDFSVSEAFIGSLSQLNIWDSVLSDEAIQQLGSHCDNDAGNVVAWGDFRRDVEGAVKVVSPTAACQGIYKRKKTGYNSRIVCVTITKLVSR